MTRIRRAVGLATGLVLALLAAEGIVRLQQRVGPLVDLDLTSLTASRPALSYTLNHGPRPEETRRHPALGVFTCRYDADGLRLNSLRRPCPEEGPRVRILFLGDSFMQGYDDAHTIPQAACASLASGDTHLCVECLNGGYWSYSPAIYVAQARRLLPKLAPDILVVDIDETDLIDDTMRYKALVRLDRQGVIEAVLPSPLDIAHYEGYEHLRTKRLYITRLVLKAYHTRIRMPRLRRRESLRWQAEYGDLHPPLSPARYGETDAETRFAGEIAFFEKNLRDLIRISTDRPGGPARMLMAHHPHYLNLVEGESSYNTLVSDIVAGICRETGIPYYDATMDFKAMRDEERRALFDWPEDPYSHLTPQGMRVYGALIAERLGRMMAE